MLDHGTRNVLLLLGPVAAILAGASCGLVLLLWFARGFFLRRGDQRAFRTLCASAACGMISLTCMIAEGGLRVNQVVNDHTVLHTVLVLAILAGLLAFLGCGVYTAWRLVRPPPPPPEPPVR